MRQDRGFELDLPLSTIISLLGAVALFFALIYIYKQVFGGASFGAG